MGLAVYVITRDEEQNLPRCLASVAGIAEQVVVVDSLSTDRTQQIARQAGAEVIVQPFLGNLRQKALAFERARGEWLLNLDADEWLDEELAAAIAQVVRGEVSERAGYELNRRTEYLGAWIDHCGWSPEWRLRLTRAGRARWVGSDPHGHLEVDGDVGRLPGRLNHRPYDSLADHLDTVNRYTTIMAGQRFEAGERASLAKLLLRPPARFLRMYVLRAGFLDGWRGLLVSSMGGLYVFLKYAKIWELTRKGGG